MMFADFGQWRAVWQQRGKALLRKRSGTPEAKETSVPRPASESPSLDAVATKPHQNSQPTDFGLPQGWVWGADGVKTIADALPAPPDRPEQMDGVCDPPRAGEPPTPERLRMAGAI